MIDENVQILLVEDNSGDALLIREMLAREGQGNFEIEWVTRLGDGLERLGRGGIDVVLLDLGLPDSHGLNTFTRAYAHSPRVPFVVLTGLADETVGVTAVRQGAQDYLIKGEVDGKLLLRAIRYATERKKTELALEADRKKLYAVLNSLPAFVHLKGADFTIQFANRCFTEVFGEPGNRRCYEVLKGRSEPCEDCRVLEVLKNKAPQKFEWTSSLNARTYEVYNYPFCVEDDLLVLTLGIDITERTRIEGALRQSEEKYRLLVNQIPAVVFKGYGDWSVDFFDNKIEALTGYSKEEFDSHQIKWCELILPEDLEQAKGRFINGIKTGGAYGREYRLRKKDGGIVWIQAMGQIFYDAEAQLDYVSGVFFDITARKRAEEEVKRNEARLASLLRISQYSPASIQELLDYALDEAIALTGSKIGYIYFFDETTQQFTLNTWSKEVMQGCTVAESQTIYQLEKTGIWGEAVRQARPFMVNDFQAPHPLKKGYPEGHAPLYKYLTIPVISGNRIVAVVGVANKATDYDDADVRQLTLMMDAVWKIVERQRAEEELRKSQERYRLLVDQIPATVFKGYPDWSVEFLDDKVEELTGYPKADFDSRKVKWCDLIPEKDFDYAQRVFIEALKTDKSYVREHRIRRKDGEIRWVQCRGQIFCDADGNVIHSSGVTFDVTKHKQTEESLRESEERFRTIFEDAAIGISLTDLEGRIINCNPAMQKMMGCTPDELIGKTFLEITHPDDREKSLELFHDLLGGRIEHYQLEKRYLRTDGQYLWARITVSSVKESESAPLYNIAMIEDITRRKEAEESFRHLTQELIRAQEQERHKISRELHDTVAQELSFLKIGLANLAQKLSEEQAQEIEWNVKNLLEALQKSLDLLRSISYDLRPPDLDLGLVRALKLHCEEFTERTGINVDFLAAGIKSTQLDDDAVINLYRIVQEGLTNVWRHAQAVNVNIRLVASYPKIILRLEDDGQGFNVMEQEASRYRDKHLGLLGMRERVALLGGELRIESQLKKGTKITIEIPWKGENFGPKEEASHR